MAIAEIPEKYDGLDVDKWLEQQEDNTHCKLFAAKHYTCEEPVGLGFADKKNMKLDGQGATIHRTLLGLDSEDPRTHCHLRFDRVLGLEVMNTITTGPHSGGGTDIEDYISDFEAQHAIWINECGWFHIHNNIASDVYGDIIYVAGRANKPSMIFRINDNYGARTGRQGIAVCNAKHGTVERNWLWDIRRSTFDCEPIDKSWVIEDVGFLKNLVGVNRGFFFACLGEGPIKDVTIADNLANDYIEIIINNRESKEPQPRSNVKVLRNISHRPNYGTPSGKVQMYYDIEGIEVRGNVQPKSQARITDFARFVNCTDVVNEDNQIR